MKKIVLALAFISTLSTAQKKDITLEDIWSKGTFRGGFFSGGESMNDGLNYTTLEYPKGSAAIVRYSYKTGKAVDTLLKASQLFTDKEKTIMIESYSFSSDESKILISNGSESIYRHSTREANYIYDRKSKTTTPLSANGKQMYASFSPDGNKVAFVRENNLFIKNLLSGAETQITNDGKINSVINGAVDWVYEEEFSMSQGFEWSPDGKKIAYYKFDESRVKEFSMNMYGSLYPTESKFKYPKAGEDNSIVNVFIYDVEKNNNVMVDIGKETNQYIPRISWMINPNQLCVVRMNRLQNKVEMLSADAGTGATKVFYTETSSTYVDIHEGEGNFFYFLNDGKTMIIRSDNDGYSHLYQYDLNGNLIKQITKGNWDVMSFYGIDEKTKTLFYTSTETSATEKDLYSIKLDGSGKKKLSAKKGTNRAEFSSGFKFYINTWSDANTPSVISLHSADGKMVRELENNANLNKKLSEYNLSKKEFFSFKTLEGIELNGWMIKPSNFDATKKYPVFMTVYGGPGANTVNNAWEGSNYFWHQLIAQKGYIVVSVDNRGTGGRGVAFKNCTYKQLGKLETIDQIEAAKYLASQSYIDGTRIGIQGWSYGGYMTSLCMTKGAEQFKVGIAVAPVTNWRYYDTIYTERYLQTPQENAEGYDDNSPINHVKKLKGKYLLIHGTADDNVHFQNSVEMTSALVKANKQYDVFYYPDKNHGIFGGNTRLHLYTMMTNYLLENL